MPGSGLRQLISNVTAFAPGVYRATIPPTWMQGSTAYGGCSAALCLQAVRLHLNDALPLRSGLISFMAATGGHVEVHVSQLRRGKKGMVFLKADIKTSAGELAVTAIFAFGADRESSFSEAMGIPAPKAMPRPETCEDFWIKGLTPSFATNFFEARLASGGKPFSGSNTSDNFVWVRHKDDIDTIPSTQGNREMIAHSKNVNVAGDVSLIALADSIAPPVVSRCHGHAPIATATWMINIIAADSSDVPAESGGWFLMRSKAESAFGGYSSQDMTVWGSGGVPIAVARQCVTVFDKPRSSL